MMKKVLALLLFCSLAVWGGKIAAGYEGTSDYDKIAKGVVNTGYSIKMTKGDIESLRALVKEEDVDLAVVQDDIIRDLIRKRPEFKSRLKVVAPLYRAAIALIVPRFSSIETFQDLADRRVIVDVEGSGDYYTFLRLQEKNAMKAEVFNISKKKALRYLKSKKADAWFYVGDLKDIEDLSLFYKVLPVVSYEYKIGAFKWKGDGFRTSYVGKFLLTTSSKSETLNKKDLFVLLADIVENGNREYLCGGSIKPPLKSENYIYFVCSETLNHTKKGGGVQEKKRRKIKITNKMYYDNIEDIVIYPLALADRNFNDYGTSYIVEKTKLDNAIKLIKKELAANEDQKVVVLSYGPGGVVQSNMNRIYRALKKSGISRSRIIKKIRPLTCQGECFSQTKVTFRLP